MNKRGLVLILAVMITIISSAQSQRQTDLDKMALELVSELNKIPIDKLQIANSAKIEFPFQEKVAFSYKIEDISSGMLYAISIDEKGKEIDTEKLLIDEQNAYVAKNGKIEKALAEQMTAQADEQMRVVIWLKEGLYTTPERPDLKNIPESEEELMKQREEVEVLYKSVDENRAVAVEKIVSPVISKLKEQNIEATADIYTPVIFANLTSDQIKEVAKMDEVEIIYQDIIFENFLDIARPTINADNVWNRNIAGFGVKVGEVEVGGQINKANPYLGPPSIYQDTLYSCLSGHATAVAGIIRGWNPTYFGVSPGAWLWIGGSCYGWGSELMNRETAAANWGTTTLTNSWGANNNGILTYMDRFMDGIVMNRARTVIISAGNAGGGHGYVGNPATSYNGIAVGASDDKNTITWSDDIVAPYSSWRDPWSLHGDREKPEVMAPGTNFISTTNSYPWVGNVGSGTSYAAPMVAGEAALLQQRWPFLQGWPETLKAIVMTTAIHNIEGSPRLSEYDGAGEIVADRADDLARGINGGAGGIYYSCATPSPLTVATMSLTAGVRTRAAIVWDQNPAYFWYGWLPSTDLDLQILNPSGTVVASSASWDNTYEIVDFTPTVSGNFAMKVIKSRCDLTPDWLGWSWKKGN